MRLGIVGSGSREYGYAWNALQFQDVDEIEKIYFFPGNGGTRLLGENVPLKPMQFEEIAQFALANKIDLVIVGPDDPLAGGIVDFLSELGVRAFGPTKRA